ncbi:MAG: DUF99 family protein [Candidatus Micrarchaeota archaeon]|nr:DUF99 family protein [Candidatus Micrarchaeota archaeon]
MKKGSRILAITSGPIRRDRKGTALILGVVARDGLIEGILSARVATDGTDSTKRIIGMLSGSRFREQIRLMAINGIALAGLNVVDIDALEKRLGIKAVVVVRKRPDPKRLIGALKQLERISGARIGLRVGIVERQAKIKPLLIGGLHFQGKLDAPDMRKFSGEIYEALRIAHLIVRGVATGESKGRI